MSNDSEPLTPEQMRFAICMFQNRIYQSNGQRFEELFVSVMTRRDQRFRPVKPQGPIGDQGNDGFIAEEGRYFQVYAPEVLKDKVDTAAQKARDDFGKLKKHWDSDAAIVDFRFVLNDKYQGTYPTVEHVLADLKRLNGLTVAKPFLAKDLEHEFCTLSRLDIESVLGSVIPRSQYIEDIDYGALTEVLQFLVDNQSSVSSQGILVVPDYDRKLRFNRIKDVADLLRVGNYQNSTVQQYFDRHGEFTKSDIRNRLAQSYETSKEGEPEPTVAPEGSGDRVFFRLLEKIAPKPTKQIQDAAIVLIAYFFEKCDVFKDPPV